MARWLSIYLLLFGASLCFFSAQATYMSWVKRCCTKGRRKADSSASPNVCNKDDLDRRRFNNPSNRIICRHSERICCVKAMQKKSCDLGKYEAFQGHSCSSFKPYVGGDDFRECCDCCQLGINARSDDRVSCTDVTLSFPCVKVFQDCCNGTVPTPIIPSVDPVRKRKCSENFCEHLCRDSPTEGATCFCRSGYLLQKDKISCRDIDECEYGKGSICGPSEVCENLPGNYRCINKTEAACKLGQERQNGRCIDVDECARRTYRCGSEQVCKNTDGSYRCECRKGYQASGLNCFDIDECTSGKFSCPKDAQCENTPGSFRCVCRTGTRYKVDKCEDINECQGNPDICRAGLVCSNTIGSYRCLRRPPCPPGQEFVNGRCQVKKDDICTKINCGTGFSCNPARPDAPCEDIDECAQSRPRCKPGETCRNFPGGYDCLDPCEGVDCGSGLECKRFGTSYRCEDVNECLIPPRKCTGDHEVCINQRGSFECQCRQQFSRNSRTRRCERTDLCTGVNCPRGYKCVIVDSNNFRCEDIDECSERPSTCRSDQKCVNYPGGSYCTCKDGYRLDRVINRCKDIDECAERRSGCNQICRNTPGSYSCRCNKGYRMSLNGRTCLDVNECANGRSGCSHLCENTEGSFLCRCRRGYELAEDRRTCRDRDECKSVNCAYRCVNTGGSYRCVCPRGYNTTNFYCRDRDECLDGTADCKDNEFCFNTYGSFRCIPKKSCPVDYERISDVRCDRSCPEGDQACFNKKVQRYSLWTFRMRNNEPPARIFSYRIVTYGYRKRPEVKYYFHRGNGEDKFEIITQDENNGVFAFVRNRVRIKGPRVFYLQFRGDVINTDNGDLESRFVHDMYVFVSRHNF